MGEVFCPICKTPTETKHWEDGECVLCGNPFFWDEYYDEGLDDYFEWIEWSFYRKEDFENWKGIE